MPRILEVHRPILTTDGWPQCGACQDVFPCSDYLRVMDDVDA
jgi:hypothetical protein